MFPCGEVQSPSCMECYVANFYYFIETYFEIVVNVHVQNISMN